MKILNILRYGQEIINAMERAAQSHEITADDIEQLEKFLKSKAAKELEDFHALQRIQIFSKLFLYHEKNTDKAPPSRGRKKGVPNKTIKKQ